MLSCILSALDEFRLKNIIYVVNDGDVTRFMSCLSTAKALDSVYDIKRTLMMVAIFSKSVQMCDAVLEHFRNPDLFSVSIGVMQNIIILQFGNEDWLENQDTYMECMFRFKHYSCKKTSHLMAMVTGYAMGVIEPTPEQQQQSA